MPAAFVRSAPLSGLSVSPRLRRVISLRAALYLGANVWVTSALVPALLFGLQPARRSIFFGSALLGAAALWLGARRRSAVLLLVAYPALALMPQLGQPELSRAGAALAPAFIICSASLLAYLGGVSAHLAGDMLDGDEAPPSRQGVPPYWLRRLRVYRLLAGAAFLFPLVLVGRVTLDPTLRRDLAESYGGRADAALGLLIAVAALLGALVYSMFFLRVFNRHLKHDKDLVQQLALERIEVKRGRPPRTFYAAVALSLIMMAVLVFLRAEMP